METPMDCFAVGQFVIQCEPRTFDRIANSGALFSTETVVKAEDRSFAREPFRVVAVELPFIIVENIKPDSYFGKRRHVLDTREWKFRVLSSEFVQAWLGGAA
jgi:hypothetical protein